MVALILATMLLGPKADDTEGPTIDHTPPAKVAQGEMVTMRAKISDPSGVFGPTVYWRAKGATKFSGVELKGEGGGSYVADLSPDSSADGVEYYIESYDEMGNGPTRVGAPDKPMLFEFSKHATASADTSSIDTAGASASHADDGFNIDGPGESSTIDEGGGMDMKMVPLIVAGGGALLLVVGSVLYGLASSTVSEVDARYPDPTVGRLPDDAATIRSARSQSRVGSTLITVGVLAGLGGAALYFAPQFGINILGGGGDAPQVAGVGVTYTGSF